MTSFSELGLLEPLQQALREENYTHPTPIQAQSIPRILEGRDLLGCARTGTGKTAAFALPILQRLTSATSAGQHRPDGRSAARSGHGDRSSHGERSSNPGVRALVLVPTRELAAQVGESFLTYGRRLRLSVAVVYGGVGQTRQVRALQRGVDILVATPGRLLDLMQQGHVRLGRVELLVLDEADHMLDMGFIPDVRRILSKLPDKRQTLFFSATMPPAIAALADRMLVDPAKVVVTPAASTVEEVDQRVHLISSGGKPALLTHLLRDPAVERALVFARTKRGADRVARRLLEDGIRAEAIHGNKSQNARERSLAGFRAGRTRVLVATDIAARGIDVDGITHVVNYEMPNVPESYVHRIGRTARAGATGVAISLCSHEERNCLRDIERLIRRSVAVVPLPAGIHAGDNGHREREHRPERAHRKPAHQRPTGGQRTTGGHRPTGEHRPTAGHRPTGGHRPAGAGPRRSRHSRAGAPGRRSHSRPARATR